MQKLARWIAFLLLLVIIYLGWRWWSGRQDVASEQADLALLLDRVWVDQIPSEEPGPDYLHVFVPLSEGDVGVFARMSSYRLEVELFEHKAGDRRLKLSFPQTNTQASVNYKVWECDDLPPLDLCLEFSKGPWNGPRRYYADSEDGSSRAFQTYRELVPADSLSGLSPQR